MAAVILLGLPFSLVFMTLSGQMNLQGFILGYVLSVAALWTARAQELNIHPSRILRQLFYVFWYSIRLAVDIFLSSLDVARMVLSPNLDEEIDTGVLKISTQDEDNNNIVTGISSHGITITPGQLVVDITEEDGETMMHVHNLNVTASRKTIVEDQTKRLKLIKRLLGYD